MKHSFLIKTLVLSLTFLFFKAGNAQQLDFRFVGAGSNATHFFVDVLQASGPGYVTNHTDYGTVNPLGSWTSVNFRFTVSGVTPTSTNAPGITFTSSETGITGAPATFLSAGGCYATTPVFNMSFSRAAPALDAAATAKKIGQLSFPKADFPAGSTVTVRPTTTQACANREAFWSNAANVGDADPRKPMGTSFNVLPLTLTSFTVAKDNCQANLVWKTADEVNTHNFEIEQSTDGSAYKTVGTVAAAGNSAEGKTYHFTVAQTAEKAFYRLKMNDIDGRFKYSPVKQLALDCKTTAHALRVYPSPAKGRTTVNAELKTAYSGGAMLQMTATDGRVVINNQVQVVSGTNNIPVQAAKLAAGTYFIKVTTPQGEVLGQVQKLIIE